MHNKNVEIRAYYLNPKEKRVFHKFLFWLVRHSQLRHVVERLDSLQAACRNNHVDWSNGRKKVTSLASK